MSMMLRPIIIIKLINREACLPAGRKARRRCRQETNSLCISISLCLSASVVLYF